MCRNIRTLSNFEPPATDDEIRASALQFVRKISGTTKPSKANEELFNQAVDEVATVARRRNGRERDHRGGGETDDGGNAAKAETSELTHESARIP